jgi:hypothetical protein
MRDSFVLKVTGVKPIPGYKEIPNSHAVYNARIPGSKSSGQNCHALNNYGPGLETGAPIWPELAALSLHC